MRASFVVALLAWPCFGADPRQGFCPDAKTQVEINQCADNEFRRADDEMNRTHGALLKKAAGEPGAVEKIRAAERAWIRYRDAFLEAMLPAENKQLEYGSKFPADFLLVKADLTRQHISDLKVLLRQLDPEPR